MKKTAVAVSVLALALAACASPTAITVDVYTEVDCAQGAEVSLTVAPNLLSLATSAPSSTTLGCVEPGRAGNVVIAPADDREKPLAYAVATRVGAGAIEDCMKSPLPDGCIVARRQLRFSPNQDLRMRVDLRLSCKGTECPADQTCVDGACVPAQVDPSQCVDGCDETALPAAECPPAVTHLLQSVNGTSFAHVLKTPSGPLAAWLVVQPANAIHLQALALDGAAKGSRSEPVGVGDPQGFALGYDGSDFGIVYRDVPETLTFQKVSAEGNVLVAPTALSTMYSVTTKTMPWNGTQFAFSALDKSDSSLHLFTMNASGVLEPAEPVSTACCGAVAWNGTSFGIPWDTSPNGDCYVRFFSANGAPSSPERLVTESCEAPHLSPHPKGWNYVYITGSRIEYVLLDAQGNPTMAPVVVSPKDGGEYTSPRSVSLSSGKTWVLFLEDVPDFYEELYTSLVAEGAVVLPAARRPGASVLTLDYDIEVVSGRAHLVYTGYPTGMKSVGVYSTTLCHESEP